VRGVLLAGGRGTRLLPATGVVSKQLLPIYDTPMIFHPIALLMSAGVREFMLISTPESLGAFRALLGDGAQMGISVSYAAQAEPRGIAEALVIARDFLKGGPVTLALGDNLFLGGATAKMLRAAFTRPVGATLFAVPVPNPEAFGIVTFDAQGQAIALEEKPRTPQSNHAVTGLYVYDAEAPAVAAAIKPSARGELEITDVNKAYLARSRVYVERLPESETWFDTGTPDSLLEASLLVRQLEARNGRKLASLEGIALDAGWITADDVRIAARRWQGSAYGRALELLADTEPAMRRAGVLPR
jgi:glucose-1-phosphate thymidylyltransferase